MPRKPTQPRKDDPEQLERFKEMAREVEADERPGATDRALARVMGRQRRTESPERSRQNRSPRNPGGEDSQ